MNFLHATLFFVLLFVNYVNFAQITKRDWKESKAKKVDDSCLEEIFW